MHSNLVLCSIGMMFLFVGLTSPAFAGGPASSFHITIYDDDGIIPGAILYGPWDIVPTIDNAGTVTLDLPTPAILTPGTVWIGAYANMDSDLGQWNWNDNNTRHGASATWRNPGGGFGSSCMGWAAIGTCFGSATAGPDLRYQIWGTVVGVGGDPVMLYSQYDNTGDSSWVAQNFEAGLDSMDCELADCWGTLFGQTWEVTQVILEGNYTGGSTVCDDYTNLLTRCVSGSTVQARVVLLNNIDHSGETVLFQIDGTTYPATIGDNGTSSRASISIPGLGAGDHAVSVVDPAGCFDPRVVTCAAGLEKADQKWEADDKRWAAEAARTQIHHAPAATKLLGNYPNPFNPSTTIRYVLGADARVLVKVYNMLGQEVATLFDGFQRAGEQSAIWNGTNKAGPTVVSGLYIYRIQTDNVLLTEKMLFLK